MKQVYLTVSLAFLLWPIAAHGQAGNSAKAFFQGKTITWMIGSTPGGSVDRLSRLVAPYFGKYVGAEMVLQNRGGGSGAATFNYLYQNAKPDGLTVGFHLASTQMLSKVSGRPGLHYDLLKLSWLGVVAPTENTLLSYKPRYPTLESLQRAKEVRWGLTRPGGNNHFYAVTVSKVLGINTRIVSGYKGSSSVRQALISGEVDVAGYQAALYRSAIKEGLIAALVHFGRTRHPAIPDTPTLVETAGRLENPYDTWVRVGEYGYFLAAPPNVPEDKLQFLRAALKQAVSDSDFMAQADKQQFRIDYIAPEEGLAFASKFLGMPEKEMQELRAILRPKKN